MTDTKFRKGQWFVDSYLNIDNSIRVVEGNVMISFHPDAFDEESKANAHLIASAPAMYKLLESISLEASSFVDRGGKATTWLRDAESLLSKARGE